MQLELVDMTALFVAVMGDLVGSRDAASVSGLHRIFNTAIDAENAASVDRLASPLTITLGDEFQGLCTSFTDALQIAQRLQARLRSSGTSCRYALGMVHLASPINHERTWNIMGEGLAEVRARLADKADENLYRFVVPDQQVLAFLMETIGREVSEIEGAWTLRQREVALASLNEPAAQLASRLGQSTQNVYKIRKAGRFDAYERLWNALTVAAAKLDGDKGLR